MKKLLIITLCFILCGCGKECKPKEVIRIEEKWGQPVKCNLCSKEFLLYDEGMKMQVCADVSYYCFECADKLDINKLGQHKLEETGFGR